MSPPLSPIRTASLQSITERILRRPLVPHALMSFKGRILKGTISKYSSSLIYVIPTYSNRIHRKNPIGIKSTNANLIQEEHCRENSYILQSYKLIKKEPYWENSYILQSYKGRTLLGKFLHITFI